MIIKPDIDNCQKLLLDAGTGILWKDDCSIVSHTAEKLWALDGYERTELFIQYSYLLY